MFKFFVESANKTANLWSIKPKLKKETRPQIALKLVDIRVLFYTSICAGNPRRDATRGEKKKKKSFIAGLPLPDEAFMFLCHVFLSDLRVC